MAEGFLLLDGKEELGRGRENKFLRKPPNHWGEGGGDQGLLLLTAAEHFLPEHWVSGNPAH